MDKLEETTPTNQMIQIVHSPPPIIRQPIFARNTQLLYLSADEIDTKYQTLLEELPKMHL